MQAEGAPPALNRQLSSKRLGSADDTPHILDTDKAPRPGAETPALFQPPAGIQQQHGGDRKAAFAVPGPAHRAHGGGGHQRRKPARSGAGGGGGRKHRGISPTLSVASRASSSGYLGAGAGGGGEKSGGEEVARFDNNTKAGGADQDTATSGGRGAVIGAVAAATAVDGPTAAPAACGAPCTSGGSLQRRRQVEADVGDGGNSQGTGSSGGRNGDANNCDVSGSDEGSNEPAGSLPPDVPSQVPEASDLGMLGHNDAEEGGQGSGCSSAANHWGKRGSIRAAAVEGVPAAAPRPVLVVGGTARAAQEKGSGLLQAATDRLSDAPLVMGGAAAAVAGPVASTIGYVGELGGGSVHDTGMGSQGPESDIGLRSGQGSNEAQATAAGGGGGSGSRSNGEGSGSEQNPGGGSSGGGPPAAAHE